MMIDVLKELSTSDAMETVMKGTGVQMGSSASLLSCLPLMLLVACTTEGKDVNDGQVSLPDISQNVDIQGRGDQRPADLKKPRDLKKPEDLIKPPDLIKLADLKKPGDLVKHLDLIKPADLKKPGDLIKPLDLIKPADLNKPDGKNPDASIPNPTSACFPSKDGWCYMNPTPEVFPFSAIWGTNASNLWAGCVNGVVRHYDGKAWNSEIVFSGTTLSFLWGTTNTDLYAVGSSGMISHRTSTGWAHQTPTTSDLHGIWGSSATDLFAVGDYGTILHSNGTSWSAQASGTSNNLYAVWGTSSSNVYAVGWGGTILRYNGMGWTLLYSGTNQDLYGIWGTSASKIWTVGASGTIFHYDGVSWSSQYPGSSVDLHSIWGKSSTDVIAVGTNGTVLSFDGTSWKTEKSWTTQTIRRVFAPAGGDYLAIHNDTSNNAFITKKSATTWSTFYSKLKKFLTQSNLMDVWGSGPKDVFMIGGKGTIVHYNGSSLALQNSGTTEDLISIWGKSSSDVYVASSYGSILKYNGTQWTMTYKGTSNLTAVVWISPTDLWGVSANHILHFNGKSWVSKVSAGSSGYQNYFDFNDIWAASATDIWAVAYDSKTHIGYLYRYNGSTWSSSMNLAGNYLSVMKHIWGLSSTDVYISDETSPFGGGFISRWIMYYDGSSTISYVSSPPDDPMCLNGGAEIYGVWGISNNDIFLVGYTGIYRLKNKMKPTIWMDAWENQALFRQVWGTSSTDVFAVGDGGLIMHYKH